MYRYHRALAVPLLAVIALAGCTTVSIPPVASPAPTATTQVAVHVATVTPTHVATPTHTATPIVTPTTEPTATGTPAPTATPSTPAKADVVKRVQTDKPYVAITVDDFFTFSNYKQQEGIRLLEAANDLNAPLTVCPTGYALEAYNIVVPTQLARLRELITQGNHEVCNHTLSHPFLGKLDHDAQLHEIRDGADLIVRHLQHPVSAYLRPPFGDYNDDTRVAAAEAGFPTVVTWTIDSMDWVDPTPSVDAVVAHTKHAQVGDIILMHANRTVSAQALPRIIEHLRARGLEPVTLSTLLESGTPVLADDNAAR